MSAQALKSPMAAHARSILRFLARKKETLSPLLILTHDYPDPDAMASAWALGHLCAHFGITCRMAYGGIIGRMENRAMVQLLKIPIHPLRPSDLKRYPNVALMDTQPAFGNNRFPKNRRAALIIDQHPYEQKPLADLAIIDPQCGATSAILAKCLLEAKVSIPVHLATALAYGILSDTMGFYRAARPDIIDAYLKILPRTDMRILARVQNPSRSKIFFITLAKGIHSAMTRRGMIVSHLGPVDSPDLVSQIADFILTYKNMQKALCTGRFRGKLYVSLRFSNPNANAGDALRDVFENRGQAGGHDNIAGGNFFVGIDADEVKWAEAERELVSRLLKRLRISAGEFHYPFKT